MIRPTTKHEGRSFNRQAAMAVLAGTLLLAAAGCATRPAAYPAECSMLDAAGPAAIEGLVVGGVTRLATRNRAAGAAAGTAVGVMEFNRQRDLCLRAVEEQRRMAEMQRQQADRAAWEWAQNNRCVTRTTDEFGRRVQDRRECTHMEYGRPYTPGM